jgi:sensor domain CHASE-containing protein
VVNFNPLVPSGALTTPGIGVPLFLVIFTVLLFGVVLGGIATWFAQSQHRRDERAYKRETERLGREVDAMRRSSSIPLVDDLAKP